MNSFDQKNKVYQDIASTLRKHYQEIKDNHAIKEEDKEVLLATISNAYYQIVKKSPSKNDRSLSLELTEQ